MKGYIKLTSKGQLTLPKEIRDSLKLKTGNYLNVEIKDKSIILKPVIEADNSRRLLEYSEIISNGSIGLQKVREETKDLSLYMSDRIRKERDKKDEG